MGDDLRHFDADLQMGSRPLQWQWAGQEEPQADRLEPELNERQRELEDNSDRRRLKHLQVLSRVATADLFIINCCSILGFSFSEIQFQNSSDKFLFSEDSNSQSSDTIPAKKFKSNDWTESRESST